MLDFGDALRTIFYAVGIVYYITHTKKKRHSNQQGKRRFK